MSTEHNDVDEDVAVEQNKDYQFLLGHRFDVDGQVFEVCDVLLSGHRIFVDAEFSSDGETAVKRFPAATAIESLLVEEEIELFSPNFVFSAN